MEIIKLKSTTIGFVLLGLNSKAFAEPNITSLLLMTVVITLLSLRFFLSAYEKTRSKREEVAPIGKRIDSSSVFTFELAINFGLVSYHIGYINPQITAIFIVISKLAFIAYLALTISKWMLGQTK